MSETTEREIEAAIRDRLDRLWDYLRRNPSATLASGEAALLLAEIDRLRRKSHATTMEALDRWLASDSRAEINHLRAENDLLRDRFSRATEAAIQSLRTERDRAERILAALREPSESVVRAGHEAYVLKIGQIYADEGHVARHHQTLAIDSAIRAAVAVAEQEVGP